MPAQLKYDRLGVSRGIFAPAISHHDGTFYVVCTMVGAGGNFVVTAKNPAGPWSDPTWLGFDGIDPSLFFDQGRAWIVNNGAPAGTPEYEGHRAIWIQEFDPATKTMTGPRTILVNGGVDISTKPVWIEGPHLYRRGEWYYLSCAEGGTGDQHSQVIFRSRQITGPYVPWEKNPILTQRDLDGGAPGAVTSTGHADFVVGPDGNWWAVFLGCRPYDRKYYHTGRETFLLPVRWTADDWPRILPAGERVPLVVKAPAAASESEGDVPLTGNLTWTVRFDGPALSPLWVTLRAPDKPVWRLSPARGLALMPNRDRLSGTGHPAFVARRIQHGTYDASVTLDVPRVPGESAGIVAFQGEKHHFYLGVSRSAQGVTLFLERADGGAPTKVFTHQIGNVETLELGIRGHNETVSFMYAVEPGKWLPVPGPYDGHLLTTESAGGFVGAVVGLHARTGEAEPAKVSQP
jgi:alpha-N-arabinofuranosidase